MKTHPNDISNQEILEAIGSFSEKMDQQFVEVRRELATKASKEDLQAVRSELKAEIAEVRTEVADVRSDVGKLRTSIVTKGYLDDKLADFHSDIIQHTRKEIEKAMR